MTYNLSSEEVKQLLEDGEYHMLQEIYVSECKQGQTNFNSENIYFYKDYDHACDQWMIEQCIEDNIIPFIDQSKVIESIKHEGVLWNGIIVCDRS